MEESACRAFRPSRRTCSGRSSPRSNPRARDFQDVHGYPSDKDTKVNLSLASKYVGHTHGCLALTLELPFKDNANRPDPETGWSGARSIELGGAVLEPLLAVLADL